ncbi:MAG: hypothetical protein HY996_08960 [Micrococcales bacterium]|nr:hypothetical protein [Micrococcales bacterium]
MPGRAARRRIAALTAFAAEADLDWTLIDDPDVPHLRLPVREPDVVVLALQGRSWMLSAEGALPFETVPVAAGRAKPRLIAQGVFDASVRIGTGALSTNGVGAARRRAGEALLETAFDLAVALGDARRAADAALVLGDALSSAERTSEAASWFEVAVGEAERLRDPELMALARDKRAAAGVRGRIELGRAPELGATLTPVPVAERPADSPLRARASEPEPPPGFTALDPARQTGLADALVAALSTPGLAAEEIDGGSGYWPGGIRARSEAGLQVELVVFSEFGYRLHACQPDGERRLVRSILEGGTSGDLLFSAILCAVLDLEMVRLRTDAAPLASAERDALARQLDAHAFVLGERATRRQPPALEDAELTSLRRYVAEFPSRPAVPAIRGLLDRFGGPAQLGRR